MNWTKLYLNTPIPQIPSIFNSSFASMQRYLDVFYDGSLGVVIVPVETAGRVKAARGEFVTAVVDNLVVRNQFTNLFDNTNTADYSWYSSFIGPDSSTRDASTWENPNFKYIDVVKPYYKINNNDPFFPGQFALKTNNVSQIVQLLFDPSTLTSFSILLDPCTGETYDIDATDSLSQWISFISVKNDPSFGTTWQPYKYGRDASVSGGGGGGSVGPGTIRTIPLFNTNITVADSSMRFDLNNNLIVDASIYQRNKLIEVYDPCLNNSLAAPEDIGGITAGTTVLNLRGKTFEQLFSDIIFPTVLAYVGTSNSLVLSGLSNIVDEVGTAYTPTLTATYNKGTIVNGDLTAGPSLTGDASLFVFSLPDFTVDGTYVAAGNIQSHSFSSYNILFGANTWEVFINYETGVGNYYDNKGNIGTNLDPSRNEGIMTDLSNTITGRRYAWRGFGTQFSAPVNSAGVRALVSKSFLSATDTGTFDISIPAGTQEVYFFIPIGQTVVVQYVESSFADVTGSFVTGAISVDDAGGSAQSYESWVSYIGVSGYPSTATYRVTIT